jgi:hypothetical protein
MLRFGSLSLAFHFVVVDRRRIASAHAQSAARDRGDYACLDGLGVSDVLEFADELETLLGAVIQRLAARVVVRGLVAVGDRGCHEQRRGDGLLDVRLLARLGGQAKRAIVPSPPCSASRGGEPRSRSTCSPARG